MRNASNKPLISIVTPVLNGHKYIDACIQSVINQSYPHIEHIFVDGGSTDGTLDILASYQAMYPGRVRFITGRDEGVGDALNLGFQMAKGDVFGWLDADDVYVTDAIRTVADFFMMNPRANFVFGESDIMDEDGEVIRKRVIKDWSRKEAIYDRHYIIICAAFYRRQVIENVGGLNRLGNDLDFWLRINEKYELFRIDKLISHWREHKGNITMRATEKNKLTNRMRYREDYLICRRYGGSLWSPRSRKYFAFIVLDKLGLYFVFTNYLLPVMHRHAVTKNILRFVGA